MELRGAARAASRAPSWARCRCREAIARCARSSGPVERRPEVRGDTRSAPSPTCEAMQGDFDGGPRATQRKPCHPRGARLAFDRGAHVGGRLGTGGADRRRCGGRGGRAAARLRGARGDGRAQLHLHHRRLPCARPSTGRDAADEADELVEMSRDIAAEDDVMTQVVVRCVAGKVLSRRGRALQGEATLREAIVLIEATDDLNTHADARLDLAEVLELGRPDARRPGRGPAGDRPLRGQGEHGRRRARAPAYRRTHRSMVSPSRATLTSTPSGLRRPARMASSWSSVRHGSWWKRSTRGTPQRAASATA